METSTMKEPRSNNEVMDDLERLAIQLLENLQFDSINNDNFHLLKNLYGDLLPERLRDLSICRFITIPENLQNLGSSLGKNDFDKLAEWVYKRGPLNKKPVRIKDRDNLTANPEEIVQEVTTKAFNDLPGRTTKALEALQQLPGMNIIAATVILSVASPHIHPFWSIELSRWVSNDLDRRSFEISVDGYMELKRKVEERMEKLNRIHTEQGPVDALDFEQVAYSHDMILPLLNSRLKGKVAIQRKKFLDEGGYGSVHKAKVEDVDDRDCVAVKYVSLYRDSIKLSEILNEVATLRDFGNKHIVFFHGWTRQEGHCCLVMELMHSTMLHCLGGRDNPCRWGERVFSEIDPQEPICQILNALQYMHSHGFTHRDLKPDNIFVTKQGQIKVGDFGITKRARDGYQTTMTPNRGTQGFLAPEVIKNEEAWIKTYTNKADMWSLGCVLFWMVKGKPLFLTNNQTNQEVKSFWGRLKVNGQVLFTELQEGTSGLLLKLVCVNQEKRFSAEQALKHQWLAGYAIKG